MKVLGRKSYYAICVLLCFSGCASRPYDGNTGFLDAAKAASAPVRAEDIVTSKVGNETFTTAPITTWERTPATALRNGVDIAFASSTGSGDIPAGNYTLRATADVSEIGTMNGTIQFVDREGKVAASLPAAAEIHSLEVPETASTRRSYVTVTNDIAHQRRIIVYCCTNEVCWVIVIRTA